jgi:hypothetical protein
MRAEQRRSSSELIGLRTFAPPIACTGGTDASTDGRRDRIDTMAERCYACWIERRTKNSAAE